MLLTYKLKETHCHNYGEREAGGQTESCTQKPDVLDKQYTFVGAHSIMASNLPFYPPSQSNKGQLDTEANSITLATL